MAYQELASLGICSDEKHMVHNVYSLKKTRCQLDVIEVSRLDETGQITMHTAV